MTKHDNRDAAVEAMVDDELHTGDENTTAERLTNIVIQYAAEQVAAERTRIGDELNAIGNKETDLHDYAKDIHEYIEQLRGTDTESARIASFEPLQAP